MKIAIAVALSLIALPALAAPPPNAKQQCIAAHEEALKLKGDKKPHAAHDKFVACARAECPVVVRKECSEQLEQVQAAAPTIALEALDDKGNSDTQVKVTLDGQVVAEKLTGAAFDVEPGEHRIVFERASDGKKIEQKLLIVEGEKNRKVLADYQLLVPKPPPPPPPIEAPPKKVPILAFVAGGVAALGFGSFAVFSIKGKGTEDDLAKTCAPTCAAKDVSPVKRDYVIADVSLGVGIFALAAAVVMALPALTSSGKTARLGPAPWMPRVTLR